MSKVFKCNIVRVEAMVGDEREKHRVQSIQNAFVAECNAPQTNSAVLSPGGLEVAFKFMLTLQEAAVVTASDWCAIETQTTAALQSICTLNVICSYF